VRTEFEVQHWGALRGAGAILTQRSFAGLALGGTVALAGWGAVELGAFNASRVETTAAQIAERSPPPPEPAVVGAATTVNEAVPGDANPPEPVIAPASSQPAAEVTAAEPVSTGTDPTQAPDTDPKPASDTDPKTAPDTGMQLASVAPSEPVDESAKAPVGAIEPPRPCVTDACIDAYLWSLYERTPKVDTVKVPQKIKVTVKKKGKPRTVTQTVMTYVVEDFTWKDPAAAKHGGMPLMDYVIGGMDHGFKLRLYNALRAMDEAGLMPGITSGFRDDYRQSIAAGNKAASDSSFHGGSRRGGYGHGLAADLVSVKGDNRMQRYAASEEMWKWIDAHEKELGIGRPYLDRDPPHVGPLDGTEYTVKRSLANKRALANAKKRVLPEKTSEKPKLSTAKLKTAEKPQLNTAKLKTAEKSQMNATKLKAAEKLRLNATKQLAARTESGTTKHPSPANATKHPNPAAVSKLTSLQKRVTLPR